MSGTTSLRALSSVLLLSSRALRKVADEPKRAEAEEFRTLASELDQHLERVLAGRSASPTTPAEKRSGGRPKQAYIVEHEQSGAKLVWGAAAAAEAAGASVGMVNVRLSQRGRYERIDTSGDGEWIISVRKATPEEEASALGTEDAS